MAATMNAATFMGKNFSTIQNFTMNSEDLTLKQMFDITAKLVSDQDEFNGLDNTGCFFRIGALVFEKVLSCETRGPIQ